MIARRCSTPLLALLVLNALLVLVLLLRSASVDECAAPQSAAHSSATEAAKKEASSVQHIKCLVEGTRRLQCLRENDEVYLPFNAFLRKQFDVNGRLNKDVSAPRFEYYTSYAKVRVPELSSYDPFGPFGHFGSYNVEIRDRVRCINAETGVPMSVQWDSIPYFYPIQVAQFALQHYSRNRTESPPIIRDLSTTFEKSSDQVDAETTTEGGASILVSRASTSDFIRFKLDENASLPILRFSWSPQSADAWFSVEVQELRSGKHVRLNYKQLRDRQCVWSDTEWDDYSEKEKSEELSFTYALGTHTPSEYVDVVRDLLVDVAKALSLVQTMPTKKENNQPAGLKPGDLRLIAVSFHGASKLRLPLQQQSQAHAYMFLRSARWFVDQQNEHGGWSVPVERAIADNRLVLKAGWHSAMAQGHALSVLTRAYHVTQEEKYLQAAERALELFKKPASEGGVTNRLFDHWDWYEEYPTTPGSFVLNGFLYSLIGLHDASALSALHNESSTLFSAGLRSLVALLPLYDTGSGSVYDLRHLGLKTAPNLARWDYHAVHVYLLKWLFNITGDRSLNEVADRWIGYAHGKRAKHN